MKNNTLGYQSLLLTISLTGLLFLAGCFNNDDPAPLPEVAYVSIYQGSPDTEGLDIILGNSGQINALPFEFKDYSSYLNFLAGDRNIRFTEADNESSTVLDTTFTFESDKAYSIFIADSLSSIETIMLTDSFPNTLEGQAMVRFVHLSPDADTLNVLADDATIFAASAFKDGSEFIPVEAGRMTFNFSSTESEEVLLTVPDVDLAEGEYYSIILIGFLNPPAGNTNELSSDIIRL